MEVGIEKLNKNLFIVESPFQLLSALEAKNRLEAGNNILIIKYHVLNKSIENRQLSKLKDLDRWDKIIQLKPIFYRHESNIALFFILLKFYFLQMPFLNICIGEFRSIWMRMFINVLSPLNYFVLDDGNIIIYLQKKFIQTGDYPFASKIDSFSWKLAKLILILFNINFETKTNYRLITCFNIITVFHNNNNIKHNFEFLKNQIQRKIITFNSVYFFGSCLSEMNIISESNELELLRKVVRYYKIRNIDLYYIPHRRESAKKIGIIKNEFGVNVNYFDNPAELEFVFRNMHPLIISSFFSTALFTLSQMFVFDSVDSFIIPKDIIADQFKDEINDTYADYSFIMNTINLI